LTALTNPRHVPPFIFRSGPLQSKTHFIPVPNTTASLKPNSNHKSRQTRLVWRMQPHYSPVDPPRGPFWH